MTVRSAVVRLTAEVSGLIAGYGKAEAATKSLGASGVAMSAKHKAAITTVSRGFGIMGAAAAAGVGIAIKSAADFDQKMSLVKAVTGEGADGMLRLRAAAIQAGAATKFSAGEAADGISNLAKAGIKTTDILNGGLNGALALASAGEIDVAAAAEDMATAMTQFHLQGTQATHVADLLAAAANKAQGEVGDFAYALNYAGLPAHALGVSLDQTVGTLALFAKNGLLGSQAGTTLRGMLSSLTSPSKKAAEEMATLGINVFDAHGKFKGLDGVAQELHTSLSGMTQAERSNALGIIFSNAQLQGANLLYKSGAAGVDAWTKKVNDSGAAARVSAEKMNNLKGDIEQLSGSLQTALIGAGEGSQGALRPLVQNLTQAVNKFNDLSPAAQSNVTKTVAAIALLGGSGFVIGKTVIGLNNARVALSELGVTGAGLKAAAWPVALAVALDQGRSHLADWARGFDDAAPSVETLTSDLRMFRKYGNLDWLSADVGNLPALFDDLTSRVGNAAQETQGFLGKIPLIGGSLVDQIDFVDQLTGHHVSNLRTSQKTISNLDKSLANIASQSPAAARQMFAPIREQAQAAGVSMRDLMKLFPEYYALIGKSTKGKLAEINIASINPALHSLVYYKNALAKLPQKVLTQVLNPGMLKTTKDVEHLAKQYKLTPREVRTIMRARDFANPEIHKVLKALDLLDKQHPKPKLDADSRPLENRYHQSKDQLIELGHMHPMSTLDANPDPAIRSSKSVLNWYGVVDRTNPRSTITANVGQALSGVNAVLHQLGLVRDKSVTITTHYNKAYGGLAGGGGHQAPNIATGGHIRGPGTATSDSIDARLSDGEYVVRTAAVNYYGPDFFHKANAMQLAGGGYVSRAPLGGTQRGSVRIEGPVEIRGRVDLDTGRLVGTMRAIARDEINDDQSFNRAMAGGRS